MNETLRRMHHPGLIDASHRPISNWSNLFRDFSSARFRIVLDSLSWSPTIALSWLWGLGFFYSFHVLIEDGWLGFLCFAAPNTIGLIVFGQIIGSERLD